MNKILRKLSVVVGIVILVLGLRLSAQLGASTPDESAKEQIKAAAAKINYATSLPVSNEQLNALVRLSGKVKARQKIDLFSEVNGPLVKVGKEFREGVVFEKGELMLQIDDTDAQLEIKALKSQLYSNIIALLPNLESDYSDNFEAWKNYIDQFNIDNAITEMPEAISAREKLFIGSKNLLNQYLNIKRLEHRLTKYSIHAPFKAVLSNSTIYKGALIRSGQILGELTHPSRYEVEANVSLYEVAFFKKNSKVNLYSEATNGKWEGRVARFGKKIEEQTQSQKLFISVNSAQLNEGMLLNGYIQSETIKNVMQLPRKLLVDNRAVYIIEANQLQLSPVEVVKIDGNNMFVRGLKDQTQVLAQTILGAYEGMPVELIK